MYTPFPFVSVEPCDTLLSRLAGQSAQLQLGASMIAACVFKDPPKRRVCNSNWARGTGELQRRLSVERQFLGSRFRTYILTLIVLHNPRPSLMGKRISIRLTAILIQTPPEEFFDQTLALREGKYNILLRPKYVA